MSKFKAMVEGDNKRVFCNPDEFAEHRKIVYEGMTYDGEEGKGIPIVLTQLKEKDRLVYINDHGEGIFRVTALLHCALADLDGIQPEKGTKIKISEGEEYFATHGADYYETYIIESSSCTMGMLTLELEAMDE